MYKGMKGTSERMVQICFRFNQCRWLRMTKREIARSLKKLDLSSYFKLFSCVLEKSLKTDNGLLSL